MRKLLQGFVLLVLAVGLLLPSAVATPVVSADAAWLGDWAHRVELTIDHTDIDSTLTDFPVLLYLSSSSGYNSDDISFIFDELGSDANRTKIAVTTSDGTTECYVEVEKWDDASEEAWLWTKVPSVSSSVDTELYFYYDSAHAANIAHVGDTNSAAAENVWDSNFKAVYHMSDGADTSHIYDSTSNNYDGTKLSAGNPVEATGKIANAQDFSTDYIDTSLSSAETSQTVEMWVYSYSAGDKEYMLDIQTGRLIFGYGSGTAGKIGIYDGAWKTFGNSPSLNTWHKLVFILNGGTSKAKLFIDNVQLGVELSYSPKVVGGTVRIGERYSGDPYYFNGKEDEIKLSNIIRTDIWNKATYESERDDLLDWGSEEELVSVVTNAASLVEETTATLNGRTSGFTATERGFEWGLTSGYGDSWTESDSYPAGSYSHGITSLSPGTTYHFKAKAYSAGTGWVNGEDETFSTKPEVPYNLALTTPSSGTIHLVWTKGEGAVNTYVRGKLGSYPTDRSDGYEVYNNTGSSCDDSGLTGGSSYYYRIWSYTLGKYSDACDESAIVAVTSPSVTTNAATAVSNTAALVHGEVTNTGGATIDKRGFVWDVLTHSSYGADLCVGGSASADTVYSSYPASKAFDDSSTTFWDSANSAFPHWIKYTLGGEEIANKLRLKPRIVSGGNGVSVKNFLLQGSNNDASWTTLLDDASENSIDWQEWTFSNTVSYQYYRLYIEDTYDTATNHACIFEIELMKETTNPGNTAPGASDYSDDWTQSGSYAAEAFEKNLTGLVKGETYYFRACAHNSIGWTYGTELSFATTNLALWFQLNGMVSDSTVPDRSGNGNNGTINWGSNPSGVSTSIGGLESTTVTGAAGQGETTSPDYTGDTPATDLFEEGTGENIPIFYPFFKMASDETGWPIQIFWIMGAGTLAIIAGALTLMYLRSMMLAGLVTGGVVLVAHSMGIMPLWTLIVYAFMAITFIVYQRVVSV